MHSLLAAASAVAAVPFAAGLAAAVWNMRRSPGSARGLVFHSIPASRRPGLSFCSASTFEALCARLAADRASPVTVREAVTSGDDHLSPVLTFDDGFADFYEHVLPVVSRHGFRVTVFPIADFVGKRSSWDVFPTLPHLSGAQLREIADLGHEVGSHTLTHADLTLLDDDNLVKELRDSKRIIEDFTGTEVTSLSFPCGRWNRRVWDCARSLGYTGATLYTRTSKATPGLIPLAGAYAFDTPTDLLARIGLGPHSPLSQARGRIMPHFAKGTSVWRWRSSYRIR